MMLTSAHGTSEPDRQPGFTLLELLISLLVMSIAISLVVINIMPDSRSQLRGEAERLALLLENAGIEARVGGRPLAWSSTKSGYQFWRRNDNNNWVRIEDDGPFRQRSLPQDVLISETRVEEQPLQHDERLVFSASVLPRPYLIRMSNATLSLYIIGKSTGDIAIQNDAPTPPIAANAQP
jgi:general secretion pathway protein H